MRKNRIILYIVVFVLGFLAFAAYNIFGPVVSAPAKNYFYIPTGSNYADVENGLKEQGVLKKTRLFNIIARQLDYPQAVKPGRYEIKNGSNLISLVRMLKAGRQVPVKLVINKWRTVDDMRSKIARNFEVPAQQVEKFLYSNDSLSKWNMDTTTLLAYIIPATYEIYWNSSLNRIIEKLKDKHDRFWNEERVAKARAKNLSPLQVHIIASIVDEETNMAADKGNVASVYINRLRTGMKLQADPTVKFALRDFTLKRILYGHLKYPSPYNTYYTAGLPPGPICTAQPTTLDAVLDAPETKYLFFAAKPDFKGAHVFAETYADHKKNASAYQEALDSLIIEKQNRQN